MVDFRVFVHDFRGLVRLAGIEVQGQFIVTPATVLVTLLGGALVRFVARRLAFAAPVGQGREGTVCFLTDSRGA